MKVKEILSEGTWQAPQSLKQAQALAALMRKPIPANRATRILYDLVGDDDLFDKIDEVDEKDGPDVDIRHLVAYKLQEWMSDIDFRKKPSDFDGEDRENFGWREPWDPKAVRILKGLVKRFGP